MIHGCRQELSLIVWDVCCESVWQRFVGGGHCQEKDGVAAADDDDDVP